MALMLARVVNLVLVGMLTGNEFGSWRTVHPAFDDLPLPTRVRAEQAVTRRYGQIMPFFMSSAIASFLPVLALSRDRSSSSFRLSLTGMLCYAGMLGITLTRNVPINNKLLALAPDTTANEEFVGLRARWDRLHTARNLLNIVGLIMTIVGALSGARSTR